MFLVFNDWIYAVFFALIVLFLSRGVEDDGDFWKTRKGRLLTGVFAAVFFIYIIGLDMYIWRKSIAFALLVSLYVLDRFKHSIVKDAADVS
ncbi:hypothetical protein [Metabacillus mangrovi]|nr:hypothetical protein [Metabacillus mangrovi]